jgi:hypothetical protein
LAIVFVILSEVRGAKDLARQSLAA